MKKVKYQYYCDCCGERITDEVKAIMVGKINLVDDAFTREEDIKHYHDYCLANILLTKPPVTKKKIDHGRIVALYTADPPRSLKWIAEDIGCSVQTVINHLTKEGIYKNDTT